MWIIQWSPVTLPRLGKITVCRLSCLFTESAQASLRSVAEGWHVVQRYACMDLWRYLKLQLVLAAAEPGEFRGKILVQILLRNRPDEQHQKH